MNNNDFISKIDYFFLRQYFVGKISLFRYFQNIFIKYYGKKCFGKVLEIGAKKSNNYKQYFPNCYEYITSNIEEGCDMILDATKMDSINNNSIDSIVIISVLEHIYDYQKLIDEVERVLVPGGKLILTVPFGFPIHDKTDYWRFSNDFFRKYFKNFNILSITHLGGRLSTIVNSLQRPCGNLKLRYIIYKIIGFLIAIIAIRLDVKDSFPLGYGIFVEKRFVGK